MDKEKESHKPITLKSIGYGFWGQLFGRFADAFYDIEITPQSDEHLERLKAELNNRNSAIVYSNHVSADDFFLVLAHLMNRIGSSIREIGIPKAAKYDDLRTNPGYAVLSRSIASITGVRAVIVASFYERSNYSEEQLGQFREQFDRITRSLLQTPGGVLYIHPEGTRRGDGQLLRARLGVAKLGEKFADQLCYLPVGIIPGSSTGRGLNMRLGNKSGFTLNFGEPFKRTEVQELASHPLTGNKPDYLSALMARLGILLPESMWGHYRPHIEHFQQAGLLPGRIE